MSGLGEFDLIDALSARLDPLGGGLGIGDDAAAWQPRPGASVVATTDMLVEGIHFRLDWTSPRDLGWKALAVNLSDLAAMGARPGRGLVSVALLPGQAELVEELYEGMSELARLTGTRIVGGDTVRTPGPLVVNVALIGEADPDRLLRRNGARPGDLLVVTGAVGASAAGLDLLLRADGESLAAAGGRATPRRASPPGAPARGRRGPGRAGRCAARSTSATASRARRGIWRGRAASRSRSTWTGCHWLRRSRRAARRASGPASWLSPAARTTSCSSPCRRRGWRK